MPYISEEKRKIIQESLKNITNVLHELNLEDINSNIENRSRSGNLNYIFTYLINEMYNINRYYELNDAIGLLECCKLELYRRRVAPYEDIAIKKNGDMPNYPKL